MDILTVELIKDWAKAHGLNARDIDSGVMIKLKGETKAMFTIYWRTNCVGNAFEVAFNPSHKIGRNAYLALKGKYTKAQSNKSHKWPRVGDGVFSLAVLDDLTEVLFQEGVLEST